LLQVSHNTSVTNGQTGGQTDDKHDNSSTFSKVRSAQNYCRHFEMT